MVEALVAFLAGGLSGALAGALGGLLMTLHLSGKRQAPALPPPTLPPNPSTGFDFVDKALSEAPERFEQARRNEEIRKRFACAVCGEPTQIVCPGCSQRVCVPHQQDHACSAR